MRLVFVGPPGAGKGTQSEWLTAYLSIPHLSTGDMLRAAAEQGTELGQAAQSYIEIGKLVPDELVMQIVGLRLDQGDCGGGFLLDGFPRTVNQAEALDALRGLSTDRLGDGQLLPAAAMFTLWGEPSPSP